MNNQEGMAQAVPIFLSGAWCETFPQHLPNHEIPSAALRGKTKGAEVCTSAPLLFPVL